VEESGEPPSSLRRPSAAAAVAVVVFGGAPRSISLFNGSDTLIIIMMVRDMIYADEAGPSSSYSKWGGEASPMHGAPRATATKAVVIIIIIIIMRMIFLL
jgi:hypothetical protein